MSKDFQNCEFVWPIFSNFFELKVKIFIKIKKYKGIGQLVEEVLAMGKAITNWVTDRTINELVKLFALQ